MRRPWSVLLVAFALVVTQACGEEGCSIMPPGKSRPSGGGGGDKPDKGSGKKKKPQRQRRQGQTVAPASYYADASIPFQISDFKRA